MRIEELISSSSAVAVEADDDRWSYAELEANARAIAQTLRGLRGRVVAVTGERGVGLIAAVLGILQADCVLLTIDPKLPEARQQLMLERSRAALLLRVSARQLVEVQELSAAALQLPSTAAYVFFTSGSTGTPKAVLGRRDSLAHFIHWQRETFAIRASDRFAQLTGLSFDVLLRDLLLPLASGATICVPSVAAQSSAQELLGWLSRERVTVLHTVPSVMRYWLARLPRSYDPAPLRVVFFAGEPLTDLLLLEFRRIFGAGAELVNLYGPTETTMARCFYRVPLRPSLGVQPIGEPIPDTEILILDEQLQRCPCGDIGQIAIRTDYGTLGYLNDPEANQRAWCLFEGSVVYLTGDRGRRRADGLLDILGRLDRQVKIRGVRVEPAEVELTLARHPAVVDCAVLPQEGELVAVVVLRGELDPTVLEAFLVERLPRAAVPRSILRRPSLPLNPNGKVDRTALQESLTVPRALAREQR